MLTNLVVFLSGSHHPCFLVITCNIRGSVLDWTLACCKYRHICWNNNILTIIFFRTSSFTFNFTLILHFTFLQVVFTCKSSISCQGMKFWKQLKSLSKRTFAFPHSTHAYLSLVGCSNMTSLKISLRGFSICAFPQLTYSIIVRFLFIPLSWISKSLILVTNCNISIPFNFFSTSLTTGQNSL